MKTLFALCVLFSMFGVDYDGVQELTYEHTTEIVDTNQASEEPVGSKRDEFPPA